VADEEYASIGTEAIAKQWRADAAIVTEPTDLEVCVAHKGFVWLDVATHGVAAHGSRPDLGVDAIVKMGHFLVELEKLDLRLRAAPSHPLLKSGSIHASLISGGQELSSYPERALLQVERRTVPGEDLATVEGQIQAILDQLAARDASFKGTAKSTFVRLPFEVATDTPIVRLVTAQVERAVGKAPAYTSGTGWMDSAILAAAGIPTVIFGPSGAGAHAVEEWVDLDSVRTCADVLLATAQAFCA
jgi:acetylornithine deacetylase